MIHIVQNSQKKFEVRMVAKNGNLLLGTSQGYERRTGCYKAIRSCMKDCFGIEPEMGVLVQDDTVVPSVIFVVYRKSKNLVIGMKPKKRYEIGK